MKKTIAALAILFGAIGFGASAQQSVSAKCEKAASEPVTAKASCCKGEAEAAQIPGAPVKCEKGEPCGAKAEKDCKGKGDCKKGDCKKGDCKKGDCKKGDKGPKQGCKGDKCKNPAMKGITLSDEQKATMKEKRQAVSKKYGEQFKKLKEQERADMEKELKKVLTADQWKQYEANKAQMEKMAREQGQDWTQKAGN